MDVCTCMYVCMYVCMHACMHACMYVTQTMRRRNGGADGVLISEVGFGEEWFSRVRDRADFRRTIFSQMRSMKRRFGARPTSPHTVGGTDVRVREITHEDVQALAIRLSVLPETVVLGSFNPAETLETCLATVCGWLEGPKASWLQRPLADVVGSLQSCLRRSSRRSPSRRRVASRRDGRDLRRSAEPLRAGR